MTRLLLMIFLVLISGPAYAEWVSVGESDLGATVYVDRDTIRRNGNLVKMWELYDFKTVQTVAGKSLLSSKSQRQYDCTEERHRLLTFMDFSGNMGRGNVVYSNSVEDNWEPVAPETVGQSLWEVACAKK